MEACLLINKVQSEVVAQKNTRPIGLFLILGNQLHEATLQNKQGRMTRNLRQCHDWKIHTDTDTVVRGTYRSGC